MSVVGEPGHYSGTEGASPENPRGLISQVKGLQPDATLESAKATKGEDSVSRSSNSQVKGQRRSCVTFLCPFLVVQNMIFRNVERNMHKEGF